MKRDSEGWYHPDFTDGMAAYLRRAADLRPVMERPRKRSVAVQAGGHVGIVPRLLAERFRRVYTFEPEPRNFECLAANTAGATNLFAARGLLGKRAGCRDLAVHGKSSGGHQIAGSIADGLRPGPYPTHTVDGLALDECDALFLDIEGFELFALQGAHATIERFHPIICAEENKKMARFGRKPGDLASWLAGFGYRQTGAVGEDLVFEVPA